ncbi:MAG: hypothetical protein AVDCRST_MAG38-626, partial [uncultured Solirubrobacteraceae bacterium]
AGMEASAGAPPSPPPRPDLRGPRLDGAADPVRRRPRPRGRRRPPGRAARQRPLRRLHRWHPRTGDARGDALLPGPARAGGRRDRRTGHPPRARPP